MIKNLSAAFLLIALIFLTYQDAVAQNVTSSKAVSDSIDNAAVPCEANASEFQYVFSESVNSFMEKLNSLGACGYRLEKLTKFFIDDTDTPADINLFAIVKLDKGNKYEYESFESLDVSDLAAELNKFAKKGFYFRKNVLFIQDRCGEYRNRGKKNDELLMPIGVESFARELSAVKGSIFVVERKNAVVKNIEYRILTPYIGWGKSDAREVNAELSEYAAQGFHPVAINYLGQLTQYAVVLEKDKDVKSEMEYRIIREEFGYLKRINLLGKEGFEPFLAGINFAVLRRQKGDTASRTFDFTASYDGIRKRLAKTAKKPGRYYFKGMSDFYCTEPADDNLFFGSPLPDDGKRYDYKILSMVRIWKLPKNTPIVMKPSPENLAAFNDFLNKGYALKELFYTGEIVVLFEKEIK